jgi:hypothetical protein
MVWEKISQTKHFQHKAYKLQRLALMSLAPFRLRVHLKPAAIGSPHKKNSHLNTHQNQIPTAHQGWAIKKQYEGSQPMP